MARARWRTPASSRFTIRAATRGAWRPRRCEYLRAAGRDASAKYANREAADYLTAALAIAEQDSDVSARADLVDRSGARAAAPGRLRRRRSSCWQRALDAARAANDHARVATIERSIGLARYWSGAFDQALAHYEAATRRGAPRGRSPPRGARADRQGELPAGGRQVGRVARRGRARAGDRVGVRRRRAAWRACTARCCCCTLWTGPAEQARRARHAGHRARGARLASAAVAWSAHWALAVLAGLTGDVGRGAPHIWRRRIASRTSCARRCSALWTSEVEIEYAAGIGDWDHGVALAERTIAMARVAQPADAAAARARLGRAAVSRARRHRARQGMRRRSVGAERRRRSGGRDSRRVRRRAGAHRTRRVSPRDGPLRRRDSRRRARAQDRRPLRLRRVGDPSPHAGDRRGVAVGERSRSARAALAAAAAASNRRCSASVSASRGPMRATRSSRCCTASKERAVALLQGAVEALEAIPYVPDAARVRRQLARVLAETGDREGATRELRRAHEVFAHLGAERELDATREQLRELGARPPTRSRDAGRRRPHRPRAGDRAPRRGAAIEQGDRHGARHLGAHGEHAPVEHLLQARRRRRAASWPTSRARPACSSQL